MVTTIANPIYDLAFKYLMEDERVVKILLSALLRKLGVSDVTAASDACKMEHVVSDETFSAICRFVHKTL